MIDMKKILIILFTALVITACGSNEELTVNTADKKASEIASVLNGRFVSSVYSETTNATELTDITFYPYNVPSTEEWTSNGTSEKVTFYGTCNVVTFHNDRLLEVSKKWKYSIRVAYEGAQAELCLYPEAYGLTETHKLSVVTPSSFTLDNKKFIKK